MMELIFGWFLKGVTGLTETILNIFNDFLELDLSHIVEYFPFLATGMRMFQVIAVGFVAMIVIVELFRFFSGPMGQAKESPTTLLIRSAVSIFSIFYGGHLINWAVELAKIPYDIFVQLDATDTTNVGGTVVESIGQIVTNIGTEAVGGAVGIPPYLNIILSLFLTAAIAWNMFKLIIEICERYLMVGVLAYTSPLLFSTIASEGTSTIFKRWLGMFLGQLVIMTLSVWSYDLVISGMSSVVTEHVSTSFMRLILVFAACRIGLRIDTYMQQLGVGVGTTGGGLFDEALGIAHTMGSFLRGGGSHSEGKAGNTVLGGNMDSKGNVRPEAFGTGLFGSVATGAKYAKSAYQNGSSASDIFSAAKQGAATGFGFGKQKDGTFDTSAMLGRKLGRKISDMQGNRIAARSPVTSEMYGGAVTSGDGSKNHLDQTAKDNGLKLDKNNAIQGDAGISGGFMAANMGKEAAQEMLSSTARQGDPVSSEAALFGTHNDLAYDTKSTEVSQAKFDQLGSDMLSATMGEGMKTLDQKAAAGGTLTEDEQNVRAVGSIMSSSMDEAANGDKVGAHLSDFHASDVGGPDGGRQVSAQIKDEDGKTIGSMTAYDQKAYDGLEEGQKQGYVPMTSSSGATYYMKAAMESKDVSGQQGSGAATISAEDTAVVSGAAVAGEGAVGASSPVVAAMEREDPSKHNQSYFDCSDPSDPVISSFGQEEGLSIGRSHGKDIIKSEDGDALAMASAISEGLSSSNLELAQRSANTVHSEEMTPAVAESALFSQMTDGIGVGHDAEMASMMGKVFSGEDIGGAIGTVQSPSGGAVMPAEDAAQFAGAMSRAAEGVVDGSGYKVQNISTSDGIVSCEYETPSGSYQIQTMKVDRIDDGASIPPGAVDMVASGSDDHYRVSATPMSGPSDGGSVSVESDAEGSRPTERELGRAGRQMYDEGEHPDFTVSGHMDAKNTGRKKKRRNR